MKRKLRVIIAVLSACFLLSVATVFVTGFIPMTNVCVGDFSVSADGTRVVMEVGDPQWHIRDYKVKQGGDNYYITCYPTFGLKSKIGQRSTVEIEINDSCDEIYFYSGRGGYELELKKNPNTNQWYFNKEYVD